MTQPTTPYTALVAELEATRDRCPNAERRRAYGVAIYLARRAAEGKPVLGFGAEDRQ
jgi:hypothetical protein